MSEGKVGERERDIYDYDTAIYILSFTCSHSL